MPRDDGYEILPPIRDRRGQSGEERGSRVVVNNTTPSPSQFGFPIIFLGASAFAYLNLPDTPDQIPHYAGAIAVGAATSFACRYTPIALGSLLGMTGLVAGGAAAAALTRGDSESTGAGATVLGVALGCVGAIVGPIVGIVLGYTASHAVVKPLVESRAQAANIQQLSREQLAAMTGAPEIDVALRQIQPISQGKLIPA
jgi:hypothetical protein